MVISPEVFKGVFDNVGKLHSRVLIDIKGMLSLYEASFLSMEGEIIMDEARDFSSNYLKEFVHQNKEDNETSLLVNHALELPQEWRISRLEARWFIDVYERRQNMSPALLKLAKLEFNILQAKYQEDLKETSRYIRISICIYIYIYIYSNALKHTLVLRLKHISLCAIFLMWI